MSTNLITPSMVEGEPRILDTDLATRLGFDRPRKIRELIGRHKASLEQMGTCPAVGRVIKGNETEVYYLNRKQAIFITAKSETPTATDITIEIIERFDAYERGDQPAIKAPTTMREALVLALEQQEKIDLLMSAVETHQRTIEVTQPKAAALDALAGMDGQHNLRLSAAQCQMKEREFIQVLEREGWIYRDTRTGRLMVYAVARDGRWMTVKNVTIQHRSGDREGVGQPMMTQKGLAEIQRRLVARPFTRQLEPAS